MDLEAPSSLTDDALVESLVRLSGHERHATAMVVAHLAEFDRRGLHLALGYRSLFEYCCEALHLSEHAAYDRIEVARLARRVPRVLGLLAEGSIHLTALRLLAPHLTAENHVDVLAEARHKRKWQVEEIVARLAPRPDVPGRIRAVPVANGGTPPPAPPRDAGPVGAVQPLVPADPETTSPPSVQRGSRRAGHPAALAPDRYEFRFTAGRQARDLLREARDLLRHSVPDGDMGTIVERALRLLVADARRQKCAVTTRPRPSRPAAGDARGLPSAVRRLVWARDGGRCGFVGLSGRRCAATSLVEFHHVKPWAVGGPPTPENIELRCQAHNRLEADRYFAASRLRV